MLKSILILLLPLGLTLVFAGLIRVLGGPERGARAAGFAVVAGFVVSWGVLLRPPWFPEDSFARIGHIAVGAALVGLALDLAGVRRLWAALAGGVVVLVSTWASLAGGLPSGWPPSLGFAARLIVLTAVAFLILARLDRARTKGAAALVLLAVAALALSAMAAVAGDSRLAVTALMLGFALIAFTMLSGVLPLLAGDSIVLGAGSTVLAIGWAFAESAPEARFALLLLLLILFADGTAARVPLPKARISAILAPLLLAAIAALPAVLAVLVTYVMAHA